MTNLLRKDKGQAIRAAMARQGLSGPRLAAATKAADATGRGISLGTVAKVTGKGETAADACRLRTAWLIATVLQEPLQELFVMPSVSTDTVERSSPHGDHITH
jgi:hypothetical protein